MVESAVALVAEWISGEKIKLQELSSLISDKETMESLRGQIWNEINEEWAEFLYGEGSSPAL